MAEGIGITLSGLLPDRLETDAAVREAAAGGEGVSRLKLAWDAVGGEVEGAVRRALDCDVLEVLGKAWAQAKALGEFADPEKYPPGTRSAYDIADTSFTRTLHPTVELRLGACPPLPLRFAFALSANVQGLRLFIEDGRIIGGCGGEARLCAELTLHGKRLHKPCETRKYALPGRFAFEPPGIAIPRGRSTGSG